MQRHRTGGEVLGVLGIQMIYSSQFLQLYLEFCEARHKESLASPGPALMSHGTPHCSFTLQAEELHLELCLG